MGSKMVSIEHLLKVINRLSIRHQDYPGTIERSSIGEISRLRYFKNSTEEMNEDARLEWNASVRAFDEIAPQVIELLNENSIELVVGETPGATVMNWLLLESWPDNRVSTKALSGAFDLLANKLLAFEVVEQIPDEIKNALRGKPALSALFERMSYRRWESIDSKDEKNIERLIPILLNLRIEIEKPRGEGKARLKKISN